MTLQSLSRQGEKRSLQLSGKLNSMTFTFDNVLPGKYKSKNRRPPLMALTLPIFPNFLKPGFHMASQLYCCTWVTLVCPLTLSGHSLALQCRNRSSIS